MDPTDDQAPAEDKPPEAEPPADPPHLVCYEVAYGSAQRLSFAIRVF